MGIFDSILGLGTSQGTTDAAQLGTQALMGANQSSNRVLRQTTGQANNALTTNANAGLSALSSGYGSALDALTNYGKTAQGQLTSGVNNAVSTAQSGNQYFQPAATAGGAASSMLANSLGLNGPSGNAAATSAFQASPGYAFQLDQSTGAAERAAAAAGGLGSGSMLDAITRLGSNLANTEYGNWQSNLQGLGTQGIQAASGIAGNNQVASNALYGGGTTGAQLSQNLGQSIGTADTGLATGQANLYNNLGQGLSNNLTGMGQGISANNMNEAYGVANLDMQAGKAQDSATNTDNSAVSGILGKLLGMPLSSTSLTTPASTGANVGLNINPLGNASTIGGGLYNAGKSLLGI